MNGFLKKYFILLILGFSFGKNSTAVSMENMGSPENEQNVIPQICCWEIKERTKTIIDIATSFISEYNEISPYLKEIISFPMFFNIPENKFPKQLFYLEPTAKSKIMFIKIFSLPKFINSLYNKVMAISSSALSVLNSVEEYDSEELSELLIPTAIDPIRSSEEIDFSYGFCKFRDFSKSLKTDLNFFQTSNYLSRCSESLYVYLLETKDFIKKFYFSINTTYNSKTEGQKTQIELVRVLFSELYASTNFIFSNARKSMAFLKTFPTDLMEIFEHMSLESFKRSNIIVEFFGESEGFGVSSIEIPDINPVLINIERALSLHNKEEAVILFSYITNLQFMIPQIDYGYTSEFFESVMEIVQSQQALPISND